MPIVVGGSSLSFGEGRSAAAEMGEAAFLNPTSKNVNPPPNQTPHYQYFVKF